jgi:predicted PurR-regulated permease PerM
MIRLAAGLLICAVIIVVLRAGATIFVPVAAAIIVWFILNGMAQALQRMPAFGPHLSRTGALLIAVVIIALLGVAAIWSGARSAMDLSQRATDLQSSLDPLIAHFASKVGADEAALLDRSLDIIGLESLMQKIVTGVLAMINQIGVVALYVAFLLADQAFFDVKMKALFPDPERRASASAVMRDFGRQIGSYLWIMARMSALTAISSYVFMRLVGLQNPEFWMIVIFVLNFIPNIGSILGTILPALFALAQFQEPMVPIILLALIGSVQFTVGNVLFPRIAGDTLNLSFFVTIFSLFVWGTLWGIVGMFLAVPLTAMIVLTLGRFDATRPIAILMSKTGEISGDVEAEPST